MSSLAFTFRKNWVLALVALCACAPEQQESGYRVTLGMNKLMTQVLEPAADVVWDSAGFDITVAGEKNLAPTTAEGWNHVANNAAVLMESANLLMLPARTRPGGWNEIAAGLSDAAVAAKVAAEERDEEALFEAGGTIYRVCLSCHQQYWAESR